MVLKFFHWLETLELTTDKNKPSDSRNISYVACVLDKNSKNLLLEEINAYLRSYKHVDGAKGFYGDNIGIPSNFSIKAHHMTVRLGGNLDVFDMPYYPAFGSEVKLSVEGWAADKYCIAVLVKPDKELPNMNKHLHITIAHSAEVAPKYSNQLLEHANWNKVRNNLVLNSYLVAVYRDQKTVWPEISNLS